MLVNTQYFREDALYYEKHGRYDDGVKGSTYCRDWWRERARRCLEGYSVGGLSISGYHYFYLNFYRIQVVKQLYRVVTKSKEKHSRKVGERKESFPDFWDVDFAFFKVFDIAENGITEEDYKTLQTFYSDIRVHPNDRDGGRHMVYLKPRGVGASFKGSSMPLRNFCLIPKSRSFFIADHTDYLQVDGIWNKFSEGRNWLNTNAIGFSRLSQVKKSETDMHFRASYYNEKGDEVGYMSEVIGVSLNKNWQKARGKRGKLILWEELGKFSNADRAWEVARPSVEELDVNFGTMLGFGTGGVEGSDFESLRKMFFNPFDFNIIALENVYSDINYADTYCGLFTPAYYNIQYKDENGNSKRKEAQEVLDFERKRAEASKDPTLAPRKKAEMPYTPEEAVLNTNKNIFLSETLKQHKDYVEKKRTFESFGSTVELFRSKEGQVEYRINRDLKPIYEFPHRNKYLDFEGGVVMYDQPFKIGGAVPKNLYIIDVDAYRHDVEVDGSHSGSLGAIYVYMNTNNFTRTKGDLIVAQYVARPKSQEDFNRILFELAELYNAKIAFENDEPGDIIGYAKRHKKIKWLEEEFELAFDESLTSKKSTKRNFGMRMGSGKNNKRKNQGDLLLKEWLYTVRYTDENGKDYLNLHTIHDLGLLQEFMGYNPDGNFDRISAMRVNVYHQQELLYNQIAPSSPNRNKSNKSGFFKRNLFTNNQ